MDRNLHYYQSMNETMEINKVIRDNSDTPSKTIKKMKLIRSPSKEHLILHNMGDLIFDIKKLIPENDYIELMNSLKQLNSLKKN